MSKVISLLLWFCVITLCDWLKKLSRYFLNQSETKPRPIVTRLFAFSRALYLLLHRLKSSSFLHSQWQMVIHDFPADQSQVVTEAIVNMIINSQVQTLLKVFQYKSVSSLYKMLREKITSSLQSYDMHFELCKREIVSRLQDPVLTMKFRDMTQRLMGSKCTTQEYVSTDCMLSGEQSVLHVVQINVNPRKFENPACRNVKDSSNRL